MATKFKKQEGSAAVLENGVGVSAEKVELGYAGEDWKAVQLASQNFGDYLRLYIHPKYKDKYIAEPHKDDIKKGFLGWQMLSLDSNKNTVTPTGSLDEACRRGNLVLAWKPMDRHKAEQAEWQKKQNRFNRFVAEESHQSQAIEVDSAVKELSQGQITASPLKDKD